MSITPRSEWVGWSFINGLKFLERSLQHCQVCLISTSYEWVMPFGSWATGLRKCPNNGFLKGMLVIPLAYHCKFVLKCLIRVK